MNARSTNSGASGSRPAAPHERRALVVRAGGDRYAIPLSRVVEVLPLVTHRAVAGTPPWLLGLFDRHAALLPLVDLSVLLGGDATPSTMGARIVVVDATAGSGVAEDDNRPRGIGVLVRGVDSIGEDGGGEDGGHPGFDVEGGDHLGPLSIDSDGVVQWLRLDEVLTEAHRRLLFGRDGRS